MSKKASETLQPTKMSIKRQLLRLCILMLICYLGFCLMLAFLQRKLIYVPRQNPVTVSEAGYPEERIREVVLPVGEGVQLYGWYCLPEGMEFDNDNQADPADRLALICSGNGGNRLNRVRILNLMNELGCAALIVDYRGYGGSGGKPTEEVIAADSRKVWEYAVTDLGYSPSQIVVLGQSLGGGVAIRLVSELCQEGIRPEGLILQATFTSLVDAAKHRFPWLPVSLLLVDRFPSEERIPMVTTPILVLHGNRDEIVPFSLGERLFAEAPDASENGVPKRFVSLSEAGHNDIYHIAFDDVRDAKKEFLDSLQLKAEVAE